MEVSINLDLVRKQCRIIGDVEDDLLQSYVNAALTHIEQHCDRTLVEGKPASESEMALTPDVQQAAMLLVGHWVANREAVVLDVVPSTVQLGFERLLLYRKLF